MFACKAGSPGSTSSTSQESMKVPVPSYVHLGRIPLRGDQMGTRESCSWLALFPGAHLSALTALALRKGFYIQVI